MRVRIKTWLPAILGVLALSAFANEAAAQCNTGCTPPPPVCCEPPPPPPPPPAPPGGCCQPPTPPAFPPGTGGAGGNFNLNVNVNNVYNGGSNAESGASSDARARGAGNARSGSGFGSWLFGGGGGGSTYTTVEQPYPATINGLKVEGGVARANRVAYEAWRRVEKRVVIRAVCIDDRNVPHPASQVRPDRDVGLDYEGELYRCLAGSSLQYTWAEWSGQENFDHGETIVCRKGEALWYGRRRMEGHGGQGGEGEFAPGLECRAQKAERDCNERSLLRRYGAGIKVLTWVREEMYTEYREEFAEESGIVVSGASFVMDGGVGGRVF